jgi:hypothetical protein
MSVLVNSYEKVASYMPSIMPVYNVVFVGMYFMLQTHH